METADAGMIISVIESFHFFKMLYVSMGEMWLWKWVHKEWFFKVAIDKRGWFVLDVSP